jgi:superfamily I DNA/RNA helicase
VAFKLPAYQDLGIEQDAINNLPLNGTHLVIGPPGTGKTVMAIYRSRVFARKGVATGFLVYNNVLNWYLGQAVRDLELGTVTSTFHSFFWRWYRRELHRNVPTVPGDSYQPDWDAVLLDIVRAGGKFQKFFHLVIDEGQDFSPRFYAVMALIADYVTVFADENQKLTANNSTVSDIQRALGLKTVHSLKKNYRNSRPIAELARTFFCGTASGIPDLPDRQGERPYVLRYRNTTAQAEAIGQYEKSFPDREIGVLVPYSRMQGELLNSLSGRTVNPIQFYPAHEKTPIDFSGPGIRLLNYASAKGLEFDTVFLPAFDRWNCSPHTDTDRMTMYVQASRARNDLRILYSSNELPPLVRPIPDTLYQHRALA